MRLVMFDVDGTLVTGNGIDDACFTEAIIDTLGVGQVDTDWSHYANITDSGIVSEIVEKNLSRNADEHDIRVVRQAYLKRLKHGIENNPHSFQPVPGASELIIDLHSMKGVCVCIATGGWREAAVLKLKTAGILTADIPLASSDDSQKRESIMLAALDRARVHANCERFDCVLYIADHHWDFANSKKLGYSFMGIGSGEQAQKLRGAGAVHVLPDFTDREYFFRVLDTANC